MAIPRYTEPMVDYGAVLEPLLYVENEDSDDGEKIKDALDSNKPSDVEMHDVCEGFEMGNMGEFNPFGAM